MKFKIESVGYWDKPLEETYPILKEFKFTPWSVKKTCWTDYYGFIELDSLEGLVMLEEAVGHELIVEKDKPYPVITIYDDYIE